MDDRIKKMGKTDEAGKWSAVRAQLYQLNNALRTPTMHPKKNYSVEQAIEVMQAAKPFLRDLSALVE